MTNLRKRYLKSGLIVILLAIMSLAAGGCEDFGTFPPPELPEEKPQEVVPTTFITSEDRAIQAVYEHLLGQAISHEAKKYLAEFSAASDNWSGQSELFKDGTTIWYIIVDMTHVDEWEERPYWQQAGWFVYRDGRVIPSNRLQANALRVEADLQELSIQAQP
ncbi:MAG: hypothetical protein V3V23_00580 [Dehalococcoidales bacterium]